MTKSCIIIGGGTSVREGIDKGLWDKIKGKEIWSLNFAFMTMPYLPTREVFVDKSFFKNNIERLNHIAKQGVKFFAQKQFQLQFVTEIKQYEVTRLANEYYGKEAIQKGKLFIGGMGLAGTFAISLAIAEGYDEIWLLGYDFGTPIPANKDTHYYQGKLNNIISSGVGRPGVYYEGNKIKSFVHDYSVFTQDPSIKIWNISLTSNIKCFPQISYDSFFVEVNK